MSITQDRLRHGRIQELGLGKGAIPDLFGEGGGTKLADVSKNNSHFYQSSLFLLISPSLSHFSFNSWEVLPRKTLPFTHPPPLEYAPGLGYQHNLIWLSCVCTGKATCTTYRYVHGTYIRW